MKDSTNKVILDLCGGTGAWSRPYKEAGYTVYNITLPNWDVTQWFSQHGIVTFYPEYMTDDDIVIKIKNIYGILAAPPCTQFSLARTRAKTPRDFRKGMDIVEECLKIIWSCRYKAQLKFWALENPTGFLRQFLGKPAFTFKPNEFGDPWAKRTDLWGYFNFPKKLKNPVEVEMGCHRQSRIFDRKTSPKVRAITPPGFAQAFFEANQ